jgi:uncharacterized protein YbjT (DUF2867 family)
MNIAVFGVTGGIVREAVRQAFALGHAVTAFAGALYLQREFR